MSNRKRLKPTRGLFTVSTPDDAGSWAVRGRWAQESPWFAEFLERLLSLMRVAVIPPQPGPKPTRVMLSSILMATPSSQREYEREDRTCDKCRRYVEQGTPLVMGSSAVPDVERNLEFHVTIALCAQCAEIEGWKRIA